MEFLLIWVLGGDVIDSGLRYKSAAKCFSESQNAATEMRDVGLTSPQFTCIPVAKGKDFKIYRKNSNNSRFPFILRHGSHCLFDSSSTLFTNTCYVSNDEKSKKISPLV